MVALIVGLGNPGKAYAETRHNLGFKTVEEVARRAGLTWERPRLKAEQARGVVRGREVVLAKPQTYMNLSGASVAQLVRWYKVPYEQLLIVSDDVDLPLGQLRLRQEGSSGGQNGLGSVIESLGTTTIPRLRIGIGRPHAGTARSHVLARFTSAERALLPDLIARAADAVEVWLADGIITAMNQFNRAAPQPVSE